MFVVHVHQPPYLCRFAIQCMSCQPLEFSKIHDKSKYTQILLKPIQLKKIISFSKIVQFWRFFGHAPLCKPILRVGLQQVPKPNKLQIRVVVNCLRPKFWTQQVLHQLSVQCMEKRGGIRVETPITGRLRDHAPNFSKPKVGLKIFPMSRVYHNRSF